MSRIIGSLELIKGNTQEYLANQWVVQINSALDDGNPLISDDTGLRGRRGSLERHESFQLESPDGVSLGLCDTRRTQQINIWLFT